ncbi:MAG TPA: PRC-barrel domain-containing protein [Alphaproteobacteria bacterium]|nr:PRC-barrel domain-containing protein [Alphaproteobacteria bacterium]
MMRKLVLLSTVATLGGFGFATTTLAEESTTPAPAEQVMPPADSPAMQPEDQQVPSTGSVGEVQPDAPAMPPPGDAIIPAQAADEVRADTLIGMGVYNPEGEKVGEVKDILLDEQGQVTGVVLSVGGVLGLGAKSVGLNWSEVDVRPDAEMVKIHYTKEQLEAAPDFKTQEVQRSETERQDLQQQAPAVTGTVPPANPDAPTPQPATE